MCIEVDTQETTCPGGTGCAGTFPWHTHLHEYAGGLGERAGLGT